MKKIIVATVLTLMMLSPALAADVRFQAGSFLVASKEDKRDTGNKKNDKRDKPPLLIIKGKGGKVTGVEHDSNGKRKK